jgi:hypothetical protein
MTATILLSAGLPILVFVGFIVLTLRVRCGDSPGTSAPLRMLIFYVVVVSMCAGLARKDLWPFAAWRYVSYAIGDTGSFLRVVSVDEHGREHPLDARAFEPLELAELSGYLSYGIERMPREQRIELLQFLLQRAQQGLAETRAGRPVGTFARFLGPLSAPVFQFEATPWADRDQLPQELVELRVYRVHWRVSGSAANIESQVLLADTQS